MESKEYITYSRRAKAGERSELISNVHQFHGYRTTKQWVEEASQQCRGVIKIEQQQPTCVTTPSTAVVRKKDGRVHFKQENEEALSRLTSSKVAGQPSSLTPAVLRRDCVPASQAIALSPISLNVAARGRTVSNSNPAAKRSPLAPDQPHVVLPSKGEISVSSSDVVVQAVPSGRRDEEVRQVVWCNAAFEAEDDFRSYKSQESAPSSRLSTASCSKHAERDFIGHLIHTRSEALTSELHNGVAMSSPEKSSLSPAISSVSAVAGSSPATVMTKCPEQCSAQSEFEAAAGDWYTPAGSETTSQSSRSYSRGKERAVDLSKTRRILASLPTFKAGASGSTSCNGRAGGRLGAQKVVSEIPSNCDSTTRRNSKQAVLGRAATPPSLVSNSSEPRNARKGTSVWIGKVDHRSFDKPRTASTPKRSFPQEAIVEADLEADIEQEIEDEIAEEILHLSQKLAALHAKQETRRLRGPDRPKVGGISCPQTPLRSAPSPSGSDSGNKRKGRVVAAKFLQYKNDGANVKQGPQKPAEKNDRTETSTQKQLGLSDGPFLGRANPPRRSLGTPARLLMKGKSNGQQRSCSPNHVAREEAEFRLAAGSKVSGEELAGARSVVSDTVCADKRVAGVIYGRNLEDEDRKDWNQRNDNRVTEQNNREHQPAPSVSTSSAAVQAQFFPEFERKLDWVKTLRSNTAITAGQAIPLERILDEKFLKQKSERQDIHAWLRENVGEADSHGERSNFALLISGTGAGEASLLEEGQQDSKTKRKNIKVEDRRISCTTIRSIAVPAWTPPLRNAGTTPNRCTPARTTPNRCTPTRTTPNRYTPPRSSPSSATGRTVPSRYATPVKVKSLVTACTDPALVPENSQSTRQGCQTTPTRRIWKEMGVFPMSKVSPTIRKGYPTPSGVEGIAQGSHHGRAGAPALKLERGLQNDEDMHCSRHDFCPEIDGGKRTKVDRKITIVAAEYEKFVQEGVQIENQSLEVERKDAVVEGCKGPHSKSQAQRDEFSSLAAKPAKKIFIRCSDLIKDKHLLLKDKLQRRVSGQSVLPSDGQDSDDSVLIRSNTRTDSSEQGESNSRSETSIIEETNFTGSIGCQLFTERGDVEGVQFFTGGNLKQSDNSSTPDYDVVYDFESGKPGVPSYRAEDYTLEMILEYVDTLKIEREGLPRIRATKENVVGNTSPRDSGCIKRTKEGEGRAAHFYFGGESLSPNEIEGLDLESFWCLVGEVEGPKVTRPC